PSTKANEPVQTGYGRSPQTAVSQKGLRPVANSAGYGQRSNNLSTPVKRSNSAPKAPNQNYLTSKTPGTGYSQYGNSSGSRKSIPTSNGKAPPTAKSIISNSDGQRRRSQSRPRQ
uniref:Uncharacterized protein n=1 Tax=Panagrolaimus sp. JU765 TaxID=591449 RepID=A0AC34R1Q7_9BILA